jgi:HEAT repeat protein
MAKPVIAACARIGSGLPSLLAAALGLTPVPGVAADQPQGVDVIAAVQGIEAAVRGPESAIARGKPWEGDIAALTDHRPSVHQQAVVALIQRGSVVVPDLRVLAEDDDPDLRARIVEVAAAIGGDAATGLIIHLTYDRDRDVRSLAALGLGRAAGAGAYPRLLQLLDAADADLRLSAAQGLAVLMDVRAIPILAGYEHEPDQLVRRALHDALLATVLQPRAVPVLISALAAPGPTRAALAEAASVVGDPRLCPALVACLADPQPRVAILAAQALANDGDSRAIGPLCAAASGAGDVDLRLEATTTLHRLTGYQAEAGVAWRLWWQQHQAEVATQAGADACIAALFDPAAPVRPADLDRFSPQALQALVAGSLGNGPAWWPARAFAVLAQDDVRRWTGPLLARIEASPDPDVRLPLIILLDQLGDPAATPALERLYHRVLPPLPLSADRASVASALHGDGQPPVMAIDPRTLTGAERLALRVALERRGVRLD